MIPALRWIHKNGKAIPIRAAANAAGKSYDKHKKNADAAGGAGIVAHTAVKAARTARFASHTVKGAVGLTGTAALKNHQTKIKVNPLMNMTAIGTAVASGVIGAATFASGTKGFLIGSAITHGIDAAGIAANIASVAGKDNLKDRAKQGAKQEARNLIIGNAIYAAGIVGMPRNRSALKSGAEIAGKYAVKTLAFARKVLRVGMAVE